MTEQPSQQYAPPSGGTGDRWSRRPRRSANDRKIAGVAGGLGRAFGVDPIILRVAFVVLAIFGGSGVLLYALGWLLLPADGDEVSAIEGLLGRGRSSVSPLLTVLLIVVALSSAGSVFSWGLPFWPVVIGAAVLFLVARRSRMAHGRGWTSGGWNSGGPSTAGWNSDGTSTGGWGPGSDRDWNQWGNDVADRANRWANDFSQRAAHWGQRASRWGGSGGCGHGTAQPGTDGSGRSPFDSPAFWDSDPRSATNPSAAAPSPSPAASAAGFAASAASPGASTPAAANDDLTVAGTAAEPAAAESAADPTASEPRPTGATEGTQAPSPSEMLTGNRTPPAWDPLGVAPFAWDLPEPTPVAAPPAAPLHRSSALARVFVGIALLAGALSAAGVIAGWWALSWAEVSAIALSVVGVGLIIAAMRGRGHGRPLIGPGIFLALLTMALSVTGINGTRDYGAQTWAPTTVTSIDHQTFSWNAGDGTLDLSGITIPAGTTATTTLDVRAGQATVIVPRGVAVHAVCSANVGQVDCLGDTDQGVRPSVTVVTSANGAISGGRNLPGAPTPPSAPAAPGSGGAVGGSGSAGSVGGSGSAGSGGSAGSEGSATSGGTLNLTVRVGAGHVTVNHG
jgi:phage shock protein PspC (stress-responsive transcriptional regulator)